MNNEVILEINNMNKQYGPTIALKNVDFKVKRGEIRGLIGENGSGKSTIMSIASGMQKATDGMMTYKGKEWNPTNMIEAQKNGISMILQEANTISRTTVAQNVFAGREGEFSKFGLINMKKMAKAANKLLNEFGIFHIKGEDIIDAYNFEDRKLVELVRSVSEETEILVVDETTTALSMEGRKILYQLIHKLTERNKAVILISHDMEEIINQCDVLSVLRDGEIIGHLSADELGHVKAVKTIRYMMVGRDIGDKYYREDFDSSHTDEVALTFENVSFGNIKDFNFTLHKGEIVGFGGLSGSGMHEIGRIAYGIEKLSSGSVVREGKEIKSSLSAINAGIGYISKNRDTEALILEASIQENICLPSIDSLERFSFISPKSESALSDKEIDSFRIKCNNGNQKVNTLSGGNKQKVSFAKWTAKDSDVMIMDSPTRGVDIGVKQAMYGFIEKMKKEGKAILMISEELSELIGMSDRIVIMKDFQVTKEFERSSELKETDIIEYMI